MSKYAEVVAILVGKGWPEGTAPAPEATARALETQPPDEVAALLDGWVNGVVDSTEPPHGITGWDAFRRWVCHRTFAINREYWEYGTAIALGQIVEPPLDKIAEAQSADEWHRNQANRRTRLGYVLLDHTPQGDAELARREAKALDVPRAWAVAGKADIWHLAVLEGMIKAPLDAFSAAYAVNTPSLDSVRFLDADQWLANLRADDKRRPRPWNDDGSRNLGA
jgi:hypothetical protein